jgi:hypothetical protein
MDEMMPSLETSTAMESVFPMIQPRPVDTVLKALQHVNMPSELSLQGSNSHPTTAATSTTHRTRRDPLTPISRNIDPFLLSPITQHARLLTNNLREDGYAFLVPGNDTFSSQSSIAEPITTYLPEASIDEDLIKTRDKRNYQSRQQLVDENKDFQDALCTSMEHNDA